MSDAILVLNAGSSSIKFALFDANGNGVRQAYRGQIEGIGAEPHFLLLDAAGHTVGEERPSGGGKTYDHGAALADLLSWLESHAGGRTIVAAGHRVVHGGQRFSAPALVSPEVLAFLEGLVPLAPLHQPHNLAAVKAVARARPSLPQVACFDTAFHRGQPPVAQAFGLPRAISDEGVRRYGFHGLSYEYIAETMPALLGDAARGRVVVAHLGNGSSMAALAAGKSVASTMGFTALDGLMMGTRCGNIDPGVLIYLMENKGYGAKEITRLLYKESGLLGVSGISHDMRTLLESDRPEAAEAVELYVYRIVRELGSLAAALGGIDALVFTGGIGEHAAPVRERVCQAAAWLGLQLDPAANAAGGPCLSKAGSRVSAWAIPTNEELMIARHTRKVVAG